MNRWSGGGGSLARCVAAGVLVALACGCAIIDDGRQDDETSVPIGRTGVTTDQLQSEVMAFADRYGGLIDQGYAQIVDSTEEVKVKSRAMNNRVQWYTAAVQIATSKNPVAAVLDMTVMVSLQRELWDGYWMKQWFTGPGAQAMSTRLAQLESEIWEINGEVLNAEEQAALRELVRTMRERYPDQVLVSTLRASEFASDRRGSVVRMRGGRGLLGLFGLDPMAGLSPATRQVAEARLLGERAFYFGARLPQLAQWSAEATLLELTAEPEIQRLMYAAEQAGDASERAAAVAEELPVILRDERIEAIDQAASRLRDEREAALTQFFDGVSAEQDAFWSRLESDQEELRRTISELRGAVEASDALTGSMRTMLGEANRLTESIERLQAMKDPDSAPFDIGAYQAAAESATEGVRELNVALESATRLVAALESGEGASVVREALSEGTAGANEVVDRMYRRGLALIGVFLAGLLVVLIAHRFVVARVLVARA